ncbi:MAG: Zn-ribbon domain-containing OB-fold protein, partial [Nitrososphaerales archaeon]
LEEVEMPQMGTLLSYTMQRESMAGFEEQEPMSFGLVELKNGVRVVGQLVDIPYESLKIGGKVKAVFRRVKSDGVSGQIFYGYKFGPLRGVKLSQNLQ